MRKACFTLGERMYPAEERLSTSLVRLPPWSKEVITLILGRFLKYLMQADVFTARGHPLISSRHTTTLEITREPEITPSADCVIGVGSSKGCADLSEGVRKAIREGSEMSLMIRLPDLAEEVRGFGHPDLTLADPVDMVFRKSGYLCPRTVFILADKAASDLSRRLVGRLRDPDALITVELGPV